MLKIGKKILKFLRVLCTVVGCIFLVFLVGLSVYGIVNRYPAAIEKNTYLVIDFNQQAISENENSTLLEELADEQPLSFTKLLQSIEYASEDENITGLVAKINILGLEPAQVQDIARAVAVFKAANKKTFVFSQGFGSFGHGNMEYYLASFFDKIYMQPHTYIGLTGIEIEVPFFKDILNKIGVLPEFYARYEYKNAMASLTDNKMSAAYNEEMRGLGQSLMNEIEADITNNRKISEPLKNIINQAPLTTEQGLKFNLIDGVMYAQELDKLLEDGGAKHFVGIKDYAAGLYPNDGNLPTIAVLNLNGEIVDGKSENSLRQNNIIGSQNVVEDIEKIKKLDDLKAVVVNINSPGGSYNASDEIYFALQQLKKESKVPLIVSQSAYAASGGYFISLAGDYILAEPMTITGSIGVLGGKMVLEKLWQKLGVNWKYIAFGKNAGILSANKPFSQAEKKIFNNSLDEVYRDFTSKVVENRKLTKPIDKVARGRVWTGRQALSLGLIDELGGYSNALNKAIEMGKIAQNQNIKIVSFPEAKSFSEKVGDLIANTGSIKAEKLIEESGVDITNLKLFKRLQYDTVLLPFKINM